MGLFSQPKAPSAPDPRETAAAQGAINKETAITQAGLNRINQITPQGTLIYSQSRMEDDPAYQAYAQSTRDYEARRSALNASNPASQNWNVNQLEAAIGRAPDGSKFAKDSYVPQYTQTVTLSPEQQRLYNLQTQAEERLGTTANEQLQRLQSSLATPLNYDGLTEVGDYATDRARVEDALMQRMNPQLDRDYAALEQRLANQGITTGSQAYGSAMQQAGQQRNDARYGAIQNAAAEQSRLVNQALGLRQQGIQERTSLRTQPLNEISALMSGSQVNNPQFSNYAQVGLQPADYQGAANMQYQGQLAAYNAQNQQRNAMMGGLFGLAGAVAGGPIGASAGGFLGNSLR